ncbi:MAG: urease accessory protein UreE [Pseudomonadota bacterium]
MTLPRATAVLPDAPSPADHVTLGYDDRFRRRIALTGRGGLRFLLDLARATELRDGQGLALEDGRVIAVHAAAEPLIEVRAPTPRDLIRAAWHIGNRHLPCELLPDRLRLRADPVIADMLTGLGCSVTPVTAPFQPEGGAYGPGRTQGHSHG